jgi:hypothetical protein
MSELNAFIDKYILELEQIRDEVKTFEAHAVEVLASILLRWKYDERSLPVSMDIILAEAKQLLGVR